MGRTVSPEYIRHRQQTDNKQQTDGRTHATRPLDTVTLYIYSRLKLSWFSPPHFCLILLAEERQAISMQSLHR